eukprot:10115605-Alexandrium_andersonii.AAC.1
MAPRFSPCARAVARQLKLRMSPPAPRGASREKQLLRASGGRARRHVLHERTFLRVRTGARLSPLNPDMPFALRAD